MSNVADPFRAVHWQPSTQDTNTKWVPQFRPASWQRPLSLVYKQEKARASTDTVVPPWVRVKHMHVANPSVTDLADREPVSNYKYSSKAALPPPPAAYVVGNRSPPARPSFETEISAPSPIPVPAPKSPSPRYTVIERASVKHASVAARASEETAMEEAQETGSAEGQEFEIPDFKYSVPNTPRHSSLPKRQTGPTSGADVPAEHFFPPTPASVAAYYGHQTPRTPAGVFVSPMTAASFADEQSPPPLPSPSANLPRLVKVVGTYKPALADELSLALGETLRLLHVFPDDWCLVQRLFPNETSAKASRATGLMETGAVPILCLTEIGGGSIPRPTPTSSPVESVTPASVASGPTVSPSAASQTSGVSGASGQTGATTNTNTTTTTQLSEPRSHWSSATTNIDALSPFTSPGSDRSLAVKGSVPPPIASPGSAASSASGQSLFVPPGLQGAGFMPRMPKRLDEVVRPTHSKTGPAQVSMSKAYPPVGMSLRNGSFSSMFDRTRAS